MKKILVIGAGLSSASLIKYLLDHSAKESWKVTVGDMSLGMVTEKTNNHPNARAIVFDVNDARQREDEITNADIVVSMLPAVLHIIVAKECVRLKKHLVTASYVSEEMQALDAAAKAADIILMNESGLDPGIDHASAMKVIDQIHEEGGVLTSFKSYTGGLVAPEFNDNPWGYKLTWNPRNVVLAGQGTAQYIENGEYKVTPYKQLFTQTEKITVDIPNENGDLISTDFEGYANRDSLSYRKIYNIDGIPTILRGTLRMPGYCKAWNVLVQIGLTDDTRIIDIPDTLTYSQLISSLIPAKQNLKELMGNDINDEIVDQLKWLGILDDINVSILTKAKQATAAKILQDLLEDKWALQKGDKDMIVMQHQFEYLAKNKEKKKVISTLTVRGDDEDYTAMGKTVGLPMAITTKLILQNKIKARGVLIPVSKEVYEPILEELAVLGIQFKEEM